MASFNQVTLLGNAGQDPKTTQSQSGSQLASLSLATTTRAYTRKDGTQAPEQVEWHNIVLYGKLAEIAAKYVKKGSPLFVQGHLRTREYTAKDGSQRRITEIVAENIQFVGSKPKDGADAVEAAPPQIDAPATEDLPF